MSSDPVLTLARIENGQVHVQSPIPPDWEGLLVKIVPLTPDDPIPDLETLLAALDALGPMEFDAEERVGIAAELGNLDRVSRDSMNELAGNEP